MQYSIVALAGLAALVSAQTYTGAGVTPTASAPSGCETTYPYDFELSVVTSSSKKRSDALLITLKDSVLTDSEGRIGYIASNYQFQFDYGGQAGELATAGFSVCANDTLALGSSAVWYECLSGTFYNLYDDNWAAQCKAVFLDVIPVTTTASSSGTATATSTASATTSTDYVTAAAATSSDGQVEGTTVASTYTTSEAVVSSISDNQIQGATSTSAVTSTAEITTSTTVATTSEALVTSISDHQIQGATSTSAVVSTEAVTTTASASVTAYTGAAAMPTMAAQVLLAAAGAAVALL